MRKYIILILSKIFNKSNPISLMYHTISDTQISIATSINELRKQFQYLKDNNYNVIGENETSTNSKDIHLTFDDGYVDNFNVLFPILQEFNYKATIFITTGFLGKEFKYGLSLMTESQIIELSKSDLITIASHTVTHPKLDTLTYKEQYMEIANSKKYLENLIGKEVNIFAPPFGRYNDDTIKILKELGIVKSYTTKIGKLSYKNLLEIPRVPVMTGTLNYFNCLDKNGFFLYNKIKDKVKSYV